MRVWLIIPIQNTVTVDVPKDAEATGMCGNGTDTNATLTINFGNNTIEFMFADKDSNADIESVTMKFELDPEKFPKAMNGRENLSFYLRFYYCIGHNKQPAPISALPILASV